ncbi:hypothetical protein PITCH_A1820016 [uncultured Desulfobacterium sp.]|uniref:HNH domain-containing protein n=1 Tax=uncultured Desulfobacterium sp. TaxID=201089 RepID=A0A445MV54_9BACT|nr:hypothetical protein PITCH_A1820016 [uncultured Desulfobacterium sp.]
MRQLSEVGKSYQVDPIRDLVPVCPNCHAVIHLRKPPYSIKEVKNLIGHRENANIAASADGLKTAPADQSQHWP